MKMHSSYNTLVYLRTSIYANNNSCARAYDQEESVFIPTVQYISSSASFEWGEFKRALQYIGNKYQSLWMAWLTTQVFPGNEELKAILGYCLPIDLIPVYCISKITHACN